MPIFDEVLALVRAGYTRAEIDAMSVQEQPVQEQPAQEQPAQEQPAQEQPAQEQPTNNNGAVLDAIKALTLAVQASNRANITIDTPTETAESALAAGVFGGKK